MTSGTQSDDRPLQRHAIGMSVEALASAWARRDGAAGGSVVVVDSEISARRRLGEPWSGSPDQALSLAMILRPEIDLTQQDLLWLVGTLAAADAGRSMSNTDLAIRWPDIVETANAGVAVAFINVVTQLGPGRIEHSVVSLRFSLSGLGVSAERRDDLLDEAMLALDAAASLLPDDCQRLIDSVTERCSTIGRRVKASLLPRGEVRGEATAIDPEGQLVLQSPTGMLEYVTVGGLRQIEVI